MRRLLLISALLLAAGRLSAEEPAANDGQGLNYSESPASRSWSGRVHGEEPAKPVAEGPAQFVLRLYGGDRAIVEDFDGRAIALDVEAEIETCADGSTRVNGVQVGSWRYALEGNCPTRRGSRVRVVRPAGETTAEDSAIRLHCDTASLSCRPDAG